jgi:hypothetical protein
VHRQKDYFDRGFFPLELARNVETADARHIYIKHGDIRLVGFDQLQSRLAIARFADDCQVSVGFDHLPQALPDNRMVVRDYDFYFVIHHF